MWVKICGNTRLEDCQLAAELGADAVGFVFAEGKRTVIAEQVKPITAQLPASLEKIGVFTTRDIDAIATAVSQAGLTGVQLHGVYDKPFVRELRGRFAEQGKAVRVLQVVHWNLDLPAGQQAELFRGTLRQVEQDALADAVLIDSCTASASGGTGKTFDWAAVSAVLKNVHLPVVVAGGLRAENVAEGVQALQPAGVDVSSGVEQSPGVKNAEKVRAFLAAART